MGSPPLAYPTRSGLVAPSTGGVRRVLLDLDFTALATADYAHDGATVVIGGRTWTISGATYASDLDITTGTGLQIAMSSTASSMDFDTPALYTLSCDLDDLLSTFDGREAVRVEAIIAPDADEADEYCGVFVGAPTGTTYVGAVGLGHDGSGEAILMHRQQAANEVTTEIAVTSHNYILIDASSNGYRAASGVTTGVVMPDISSLTLRGAWSQNVGTPGTAALPQTIGMWALAGNVDGDQVHVVKRLRVSIVDDYAL